MSISSVSLMVGNFFAPSIIKLLGSKWSLFCSSFCRIENKNHTFFPDFPLALIGCEIMNKYYFIAISLIGGFLSGGLFHFFPRDLKHCSFVGGYGRIYPFELEIRRSGETFWTGLADLHAQVSLIL